MCLTEILKLKDEGGFSSAECSESKLRAMLRDCEPQQMGQMSVQATQAIQAIRDELTRRETVARHEALASEQKHLKDSVDAVVSGQAGLKRSIDRVHRIDVWILIAGVVAALAGVILLVLDFVHNFGGGK